jgi:hypothetical protein
MTNTDLTAVRSESANGLPSRRSFLATVAAAGAVSAAVGLPIAAAAAGPDPIRLNVAELLQDALEHMGRLPLAKRRAVLRLTDEAFASGVLPEAILDDPRWSARLDVLVAEEQAKELEALA